MMYVVVANAHLYKDNEIMVELTTLFANIKSC